MAFELNLKGLTEMERSKDRILHLGRNETKTEGEVQG